MMSNFFLPKHGMRIAGEFYEAAIMLGDCDLTKVQERRFMKIIDSFGSF